MIFHLQSKVSSHELWSKLIQIYESKYVITKMFLKKSQTMKLKGYVLFNKTHR
jgi:hypothetical protein